MRPTFVYFIATEDLSMVKIGCSYHVDNRLSALATWSPYPLKLLVAAPGEVCDERALHSRYLSQHSHREWFRASTAMFADIERIKKTGRLPDEFRGSKGQKNPICSLSAVRRSPEWRAKMSAIHKARWAKEKAQRATLSECADFMAAHGVDVAAFNSLAGAEILFQRKDKSLYTWDSNHLALKAFLASQSQQSKAA